MSINLKKIVAIICIIIVILNLVLFSFKIYDGLVFWIIIIVMALIAFPGMKFLGKKKRNGKK